MIKQAFSRIAAPWVHDKTLSKSKSDPLYTYGTFHEMCTLVVFCYDLHVNSTDAIRDYITAIRSIVILPWL